ncbi:MAG: DNA/RNA nuclease SfsA [Desulfobacterales bacterium]|nr:MAG: DNA/RNA nuclease SfsA [Desulfobacterales bacterium]
MKNSILSKGLKWPPLIQGTLVKRYQRFMADVLLETGERVTAHCPNSGSMKGCCEPGRPVYLSYHNNPKRKFKYTWELIAMPSSLVGVNTLIPNRLIAKSIETGVLDDFKYYDNITREVRTPNRSRLDILLTKNDNDTCFIEIKNCTLAKDGVAYFPDAITSRGRKHLVELRNLVSSGTRGVMFYLIQRMDARVFKPADHIDPVYGKELRNAVAHGVEIMVYDVHINLEGIALRRKVPHQL